jgi:pilus assembly protein CpaB
LIQDAVVLWVGDFPTGPITTGPQPTPTPAPEGEQVATVSEKPQVLTLIVTPQDAVTLNYLMLAGASFNLALRGSGDVDRYPIEAVTLQFILDQYGIPSPAKLPYGIQPRIDQLVYPTVMPEVQEVTP